MQNFWYESDGVRLHAVEAGSGRVIVMLHGGGADHRACLPVISPLSARYRVLTPDLRSSGKSLCAEVFRPEVAAGRIHASMAHRSIGLALACAIIVGIALRPSVAVAHQDQNPPAEVTAPAQAASPSSPAEPDEVRFTGEVMHDQPFTHDVGHHLTFRLTPATADEGGGWVIEMLPAIQPSDDPVEFAAIATPPYHAYNDRYLAAAFGYSAREAVQATTRKFNFVLSLDDEYLADEVVNAALYPSTIGEADKPRIAVEAAALKLGTGQLHILRSHITQGKEGSPDTIAWVKFDVVLNFSSGLTLQQVLAPHPPATKR